MGRFLRELLLIDRIWGVVKPLLQLVIIIVLVLAVYWLLGGEDELRALFTILRRMIQAVQIR